MQSAPSMPPAVPYVKTGRRAAEVAASVRKAPAPALAKGGGKTFPLWNDLGKRNSVGPVSSEEIKKPGGPLAPSSDFPARSKRTGETLELMKLASLVDNKTWVHEIMGAPEPCGRCEKDADGFDGHEVVGNAAQTMVLPAENQQADLWKFEWSKTEKMPFEHKVMILPDMAPGELLHVTVLANVSGHDGEGRCRAYAKEASTRGLMVGVRWFDDKGKTLETREASVFPRKDQGDYYATTDPADNDPSVHYAVAQDLSIPIFDKIDGKRVASFEIYSYPVGSAKDAGYKHHRIYRAFQAADAPAIDPASPQEHAERHGIARDLKGKAMRDGVEGY